MTLRSSLTAFLVGSPLLFCGCKPVAVPVPVPVPFESHAGPAEPVAKNQVCHHGAVTISVADEGLLEHTMHGDPMGPCKGPPELP